MPRTPLPIANGFYVDDSLPLAAMECTNWYPHILEGAGLNQETLRGSPGKVQAATSGTTKQVNRGAHTFKGVPYFVNGEKLWRLNRTVGPDGVATYDLEDMGDIPGAGRVWLADNGTQLCVLVPGTTSTGYIFTTDPDTLTEITDPDFKTNGEPQAVVFIDGYFVFTTSGKKFIISAINDGLSYNALDFGTAEADPDDIVAPIVFNNQLFIGGSISLEGYQNVGGGGFPFQRSGLFIPNGVAAPFSIVNTSNSFMFIGAGKNEEPVIWQFAGNSVQKVSTLAVDSVIQRLTAEELDMAFAESYSQRGAFFVSFTLGARTLVYNTATGRWHEEKSRYVDALNVTQNTRNRANSYAQAYNEIFVGDFLDGRVGILDPDVYTEYDNPIIRRVATQPFQNNMESFLLPRLELTVESGVGNSDVPDPVIRMDRSMDGKTWSDSRERRIGKVGEYRKRAIWRRNGRAARFEIFRFTLSDPVKPVIIQLTADIK